MTTFDHVLGNDISLLSLDASLARRLPGHRTWSWATLKRSWVWYPQVFNVKGNFPIVNFWMQMMIPRPPLNNSHELNEVFNVLISDQPLPRSSCRKFLTDANCRSHQRDSRHSPMQDFITSRPCSNHNFFRSLRQL